MSVERITEPTTRENPPLPDGWVDLNDDLDLGELLQFDETVWRNKKKVDQREIIAQVIAFETDAKGEWVRLLILRCEGKHGLEAGSEVRRARRNIDRNGVLRKLRSDEIGGSAA